MAEDGRSDRMIASGDHAGSTASPPGRGRLLALVAIQFGCGFLLGALVFPQWQGTIEPGQSLAGVVEPIAGSPHQRFGINTWTLISQMTGAAIRAGVSELSLARFWSGIGGALWFSAISLFTFALSGRFFLAVATPWLLVHARGPQFPGVTYPIMILGSEYTYGTIAHAFGVLAIALLSAGRVRWAAFLLGLFPAVHPALAVWVITAVVLSSVFLGTKEGVSSFRGTIPAFSSGLLLTTVSGAFYRHQRLAVGESENPALFAAFVRHFEGHRQPFSLWSPAVVEVLLGTALAASIWASSDESLRKRLASAAIVFCVALGSLSCVYWMNPSDAPRIIVALMPSRAFNVAGVLAFPLIVLMLARRSEMTLICFLIASIAAASFLRDPGVRPSAMLDHIGPGWRALQSEWFPVAIEACGAFAILISLCGPALRRTFARWGGAVALLVALALLTGRSEQPVVFGRYSLARGVAIAVLALMAVALIVSSLRTRPLPQSVWRGRPAWLPRFVRIATAVLVGLVPISVVSDGLVRPTPQFRDRTNDAFWAAVAERSGGVLTGPDISYVQLRSRRGVVVDGRLLDYGSYTRGALSEMARALESVYGVDPLALPVELRHNGGRLVPDTARRLWEHRSQEDWKRLGRVWGVTDVIVRRDWSLSIPAYAESGMLSAHAIFEPTRPGAAADATRNLGSHPR